MQPGTTTPKRRRAPRNRRTAGGRPGAAVLALLVLTLSGCSTTESPSRLPNNDQIEYGDERRERRETGQSTEIDAGVGAETGDDTAPAPQTTTGSTTTGAEPAVPPTSPQTSTPPATPATPVTTPATRPPAATPEPAQVIDNGFVASDGTRYLGSRWGSSIELSAVCGVLNTGAVRFLLILSDGSTTEKKMFFDGDPNGTYAPMTLTQIAGRDLRYPIYLHHGDPVSELRCGFDTFS